MLTNINCFSILFSWTKISVRTSNDVWEAAFIWRIAGEQGKHTLFKLGNLLFYYRETGTIRLEAKN